MQAVEAIEAQPAVRIGTSGLIHNLKRGDSLSNSYDKPEKITMTDKGMGYTGFMMPYIVLLDNMFNNGRWFWWLNNLVQGGIPNEPLPKINYVPHGSKEARKHIEQIIDHLSYSIGSWDALKILIDWILWGIGKGNYPANISDETHEYLYRNLNLGLLLKTPNDYLGDIISETKGNSKTWNPGAFFPTPLNVTDMMTMMNINNSEKGIFSTVCDPCVGTGRFLMSASNHSAFLYGMDIDPLMIKATKINMALYAPWGHFNVLPMENEPYYCIPPEVRHKSTILLMTASRMYRESIEINEAKTQDIDPTNPPGDGKPIEVPAIPYADADNKVKAEEVGVNMTGRLF